jgi:hypothetical protein
MNASFTPTPAMRIVTVPDDTYANSTSVVFNASGQFQMATASPAVGGATHYIRLDGGVGVPVAGGTLSIGMIFTGTGVSGTVQAGGSCRFE